MIKQKKTVRTIIPYDKIKKIIEHIQDKEHKALIALQYGAANRIGETIATTNNCLTKTTKDAYVFKIPLEKNPSKHTKTIPILKTESWIINPILEFFATHKEFSMKDAYARRLIKQYTGANSHSLRHSRVIHYMNVFNIDPNSKAMQILLGWSNNKPANTYQQYWENLTEWETQNTIKALLHGNVSNNLDVSEKMDMLIEKIEAMEKLVTNKDSRVPPKDSTLISSDDTTSAETISVKKS